MTNDLEQIKVIKEKYMPRWIKLAGVLSIGIGQVTDEKMGLIITAKDHLQRIRLEIPEKVDGIPTKVIEASSEYFFH